ncbi:MAG: peptidoglycan-associated lipoprotein Pal [Acidobacteriota bacterium]
MHSRSVSCASLILAVTLAVTLAAACGPKQPPVARPVPPPGNTSAPTDATPAQPVVATTPAVVRDTPIVPAPAMSEDPMASRTIDDLNRESPLQAVFFEFDADELSSGARGGLEANATILKKYPTWLVTIEGHCDERGTAEYNLALGERRAVAAKSYLVSLGIPAERFRTVSYGKEFPFDPGHDESAWAKNRRAHFVITGK